MVKYYIRGYHKLSKLLNRPSPCHLTSHHHLEIMSNVWECVSGNGNPPFPIGNTSSNGGFSIAMLVFCSLYQITMKVKPDVTTNCADIQTFTGEMLQNDV